MGAMNVFYIVNRFKFDPVPNGSSEIFGIPVESTKGALAEVKIQCDCENFNLHIYPTPVVDINSIMVTYQKLNINKVLIDRGLFLLWSKYSRYETQQATHLPDIDKNLYVQIDANGIIPTNDIYFELSYEVLA
jgi:hypothetical protein